jgi:hypothetical protein
MTKDLTQDSDFPNHVVVGGVGYAFPRPENLANGQVRCPACGGETPGVTYATHFIAMHVPVKGAAG